MELKEIEGHLATLSDKLKAEASVAEHEAVDAAVALFGSVLHSFHKMADAMHINAKVNAAKAAGVPVEIEPT